MDVSVLDGINERARKSANYRQMGKEGANSVGPSHPQLAILQNFDDNSSRLTNLLNPVDP